MSYSAATYTATEGGTAATVTVNVSEAPGREVTVPISASGSGGAGSGDYTVSATSVTFSSTDTSKTFTVTATDDSVDDDGESVSLSFGTLPYGVTAGSPSTASVNLTDNDTRGVTVSKSAVTVAEATGTATYTVKLNSQPTANVTITPTSGDTTAATVSPASLTFTASNWNDTQTVTVTGVNDAIDNTNNRRAATVSHSASGGDYGSVSVGNVTVTVTDDETPALTISAGTSPVTEGAGASYTLTASPVPGANLTVNIGVAEVGDYIKGAAPTSVFFPAGSATASLSIPTDDDSANEADGSVTVTLESGTGYSVGSAASDSVTVQDNDVPALTISAGTSPVTEGAGASYTLTASPVPGMNLTVNIGVAEVGDYIKGTAPTSVTFPAGSATASLSIPTDDDSADEADGSVTVTLESGTGYSVGSTASDSVTVQDNDVPALNISAGTSAVTEGAGASYTLTASPVPGANLTVNIGVTEVGDYIKGTAPTNVTFPAGSATASLSVPTDDDSVDEAHGRITVTLQSGTGYSLGSPTSSSVTVRDNDYPVVTVSFSSAAYTATEGGSAATVTVNLSAAPERQVAIPIVASGTNGATSGDYKLSATTLTFGTSDTQKTFTVTATDDSVDDDGESVSLSFGTLPTRVRAGNPATESVSLIDNDVPAVTVTFSSATYTTTEGGSAATVTVNLSAAPERQVAIPIVASGTNGATSGDYTLSATSVTFGASDTQKTFTVTATDDTVDDDGESVSLSFGTLPTRVTAGIPSTESVSLIDNDVPAVSISAGTSSVTEGAGASYTLTASPVPGTNLTVNIGVTEVGDYIKGAAPTSVTFPVGSATASLSVPTDDDAVDEAHGSVTVTLESGTGYSVGSPASDSVTVRDNDYPEVTVSFSSTAYTATEGGTAATVTVNLSAAPERQVAIPIVASGTNGATSGDYTLSAATLTFGVSDTVKTFTVTATDDTVDDDGESVSLSFGTLPTRVTVGTPSTESVSLVDDDDPQVTVTFSADTYTATEGGTAATVTVSLSADPERTVAVPVEATPQNGATAQGETGADYSGVPASLTFAGGETEKTFTVTATDDTVDDDGESVSLRFGTLPSGVTAGSRSTTSVSIVDDDVPDVMVSFSSAAYTATEGGSAATVTVNLSAAPERQVAVLIVASGVRGATTADYALSAATLTFGANDTQKTFTVTATDDSVDDDDESVSLSFGTLPSGVTVGSPSTGSVSLADDDDPQVTVTFSADTYTATEGGTAATVTVNLSVDPERQVTVPIGATPQGGATAQGETGEDYSGIPASVTFASGETQKTFTVTATDDSVDDDGESVLLSFGTLPDGVTGSGRTSSTVTLTDNDDPGVTVSFSAATYTAVEGGAAATVTVQLSADPERTVVIPIEASGGGGAEAGDFSLSTSVTIVSGSTSGTFTVTAEDDGVDDDDESVTLSFGTLPDGIAAGSQATATVNITDDDDPEVTVSFSAATHTTVEGGDTATVTVNLNADPERDVTIPIEASALGGATAQDATGADYSGIPSSVTFASGETERTFAVTATDDDVDDDGEGVLLSFGTLPSRVTAGTTTEATVKIDDDDTRGVTLSPDALSILEGQSDTYTVVLDSEPTGDVTVTFSTDDSTVTVSTANAANDLAFTASNWDRAQTVTVSTQTDTDSADDTVTIAHAVSGGDYGAATVDSLAVTVKEPDTTPPVLMSAAVNGVSLTLTYDEALDSDSTPVGSAFTVKVADSATSHAVSGVSINGSTVTLTLSAAVRFGEAVTLTYAVPASNPVQDEAGNDAISLTDRTVDNNTAPPAVTVSFSSPTYTAAEGGAAATVVLTLSADPLREVAVPIEATPQAGATAQGATGEDYSGIPQSVKFAVGETEKMFAVTAADDTLDDDGESVSLSFGTLPSGVTAGAQAAATVDIADDDVPSWSVTVKPAMMVEMGGTATLTVSTGTATFAEDQTIALGVSGTATAGTDYTLASAGQTLSVPYTLTLSAGDTTVAATLTGVTDSVADSGETVDFAASRNSTSIGTATVTIVEGICGRTAVVRDAIVALLGPDVACADVTASQLAGIGSLSLADAELSSLQADDFDGLTGLTTLDLRANMLSTLPAGIFHGLDSLSVLNLKNNQFAAVPSSALQGLNTLTRLTFENNRVETLSAGMFSTLTALQELNFRKNRLGSLPSGVFTGLSALRDLNFRNNRLSILAGDVFSGLTALEVLNLRTNNLSSLPDGLFAGLTGLTTLRLDGNGSTALSLTVSLEKVGEDEFRAVAPAGAPFAMQLPVSVSGPGKIAGAASSIAIPAGAVKSGTLSVERTAGTLEAVTADLGTLPVLPDNHMGYALVKSTDLPVEVLAEVPPPAVSISAVSAQVTEGSGAAFTVTRTGSTAAALDVSVQVTATGEVLKTATDYTSAVTVRIPAGSATATLTVATDDDAVDEALTGSPDMAGRIAAAVQSGTGYALADSNASASAAVLDNDPTTTVAVPPASALVSNLGQTSIGSLFVHSTMTLYQAFTTGADAPGHDGFALTSVAVSVQDTPDSPSGVTVSLYSSDSMGAPGNSLHTLTNPASFAMGSNTFTAPADATLDAGTTYFVTVEYTGTDTQDLQLDYTASTAEDAGTVSGWSIADREHGVAGSVLKIAVNGRTIRAPAAALSVADARAEEGTDATIGFDVTLDRTAAEAVTVSYRTVDGTAVAGEDYTSASGTLTFAPGETTKTVSVTVLDDLVDEDEETFTLLLFNASGAGVSNAQAQGTIANSDPLPKAWLVRFGRTVASHVTDGISERLLQPRSSATQVTFAGTPLPFGQELSLATSAALLRHPGGGRLAWDSTAHGGLARYGTTYPTGPDNMPGTVSRGLSDLDLLMGSSFLIRLNKDKDSDADAGWTVWGRGMATRFDGNEEALSLRGDVRTYMIGADTAWRRWLGGVAVAHSTGAGGYDAVLKSGRSERGILDSGLTSVHPYARFALSERLSAWGVLGYGMGELMLDREGSGVWNTDTSMRMAAAGTRGVLLPASDGGLELALRTDVLWTSIASGAAETVAGHLAGSDGDASRLRLILEGSRRLTFAGNRTLTPSVELGVRRDGGDAETGAGVEVGGGLRFADPGRGLSVELKARGLIAHRDADFREWGASAAIRLDPGTAGRGLMFALAPSWGAASSGTQRLWSQPGAEGLTGHGTFVPGGRVDAELSYALTGPRGRGLQTPYAALSQAVAGETALRLGWRLTVSPLSHLDLQGTRRQPADGGPADHGVQLRMGMRW